MTRRLLLAAGDISVPSDPSLNTMRGVTEVVGLVQNNEVSQGTTYRTQHRVCADSTAPRLTYYGAGSANLAEPWTGRVVFEAADGTLHPVTWGGSPTLSVPLNDVITSDALDLTLAEGQMVYLRTYVEEGVNFYCGGNGRLVTYMDGDHIAGTWTPGEDLSGAIRAPAPIAITGNARASTVCPAVLGDSIAAEATGAGGWWRLALAEHLLPGIGYGRSVYRFTGMDDRMKDTLSAATHLLVQYGVNDLVLTPTVVELWEDAVAAYAHADTFNPGIPKWQTTPTPIVNDGGGDQCATLEGQVLVDYADERQAWVAFLRDGAPCHPTTLAALPVGSTGTVIRAGQDGHPLKGIVDVAAGTEHGGTISPSGKWRVDRGAIGGDGVHPNAGGDIVIAETIAAWLAELTDSPVLG